MIKLTTISRAAFDGTDLPLCVFAYEDAGIAGAASLSPAARRGVLELAKAEGFRGKPGETCSVPYTEKGLTRRYVVTGLGARKGSDAETLRRAAGSLFGWLKDRREKAALLAPEPAQAAAEGLTLASYRFEEYRKPDAPKLTDVSFVTQSAAEKAKADKALARAAVYCEAVCFVRDLVNRGPSDKTPQSLATVAETLVGPTIKVKVMGRVEAEQLGMGSFLGVARGSSVEPIFIHLVYKPKGAGKRKIGLVGKGITFDSGGLSLKPAQSMETMKMDMAGAASVLGVFKVLPLLKPKAEIHGFCAVTYNMPGPDALKPGDVVKAMNGKTIEVLNTDAEGRLILADALVYAGQQELTEIIDLATLTGAISVALGSKVTGAMTNDKALLKRLLAASAKVQEDFCELPLVRDYKDQIKGTVADLQNIGKVRGEAGAIIGGLFLEEFVDSKPWVHLDIAGTAWNDSPSAYCPTGGTGSVVRTLLEYLGNL